LIRMFRVKSYVKRYIHNIVYFVSSDKLNVQSNLDDSSSVET